MLARPNRIIFFLFYKKTYIHIHNLYSILKTPEYDVLLVRKLHPVSPALLPSGHGFKPHLLHRFLTFYTDLTKWLDGLMGQSGTISRPAMACLDQSCGPRASGWLDGLTGRHSQQAVPGPELWPAGVGPVSGRHLAIYMPFFHQGVGSNLTSYTVF